MYLDLIYEASSDKLIPASASLSELSNYESAYDYTNCLIVKTRNQKIRNHWDVNNDNEKLLSVDVFWKGVSDFSWRWLDQENYRKTKHFLSILLQNSMIKSSSN